MADPTFNLTVLSVTPTASSVTYGSPLTVNRYETVEFQVDAFDDGAGSSDASGSIRVTAAAGTYTEGQAIAVGVPA